MCQIKEGINLKTSSDLQNLVTGTIFRQTEPFTVEAVMNKLGNSILGSSFQDQPGLVREICLETMDELAMSESIRPERKTMQYRLVRRYPENLLQSDEITG